MVKTKRIQCQKYSPSEPYSCTSHLLVLKCISSNHPPLIYTAYRSGSQGSWSQAQLTPAKTGACMDILSKAASIKSLPKEHLNYEGNHQRNCTNIIHSYRYLGKPLREKLTKFTKNRVSRSKPAQLSVSLKPS